MSDKIYPIGIQNFEKLRKEGYFYIDKTALIYKMVKTGSYYFLSRPRRFGKSLLVSTLEAYFQGKRELFEGLAIAGLEKDWTVRPVLHIDLNISKYETAEDLSDMLNFRFFIQFKDCRDIRQCTLGDNAHRIIDVGCLHCFFQIDIMDLIKNFVIHSIYLIPANSFWLKICISLIKLHLQLYYK